VRRRSSSSPSRPSAIRAREQGDVENGSAACGQSAGLIREVRPAGEIVKALVTEAEAALLHLDLK
jgi:NAD(P)H-dependent flavin oxidoreductase YrpB (nitropropane dioxygenase family)